MRLLIPFVVALVTPLFFSSGPAFSQAESVSRAGAISEQSSAHPNLPAAINATLAEGFEGTFPPTGWIVRNQSTAIGTNPTCWNQFTGTTPWVAHSGVNHAGANFNCTSGSNTISGWLITSAITGLANGDQVSFWTRGSGSTFPDRLELRLCLDSTPDSCGLAASTGSGSAAVGNFTSVLLTVNPTLVANGYPGTFTQFSATLAGLPAGPNNGRLGFRYFVTNGGPSGANSDIISIDDVSVSGPAATADLSITKTDGVTTATPGGAVIYTITASNAGPSGASGSTVADTFPASETCTWTCLGAGGGTCTVAGSGNINDSVNLPSGGSTTYTASCAISAAATGSLANTATVATPAGVTDPTPGNNSATDTDTLNASADLAITKTDGVTTATPGGSVTYTITASNAGPSNAIAAT
ncbi:MAG: choice-of-anchor J domain-containing protein, partial [Dokdonella sp.]